MTPKTKKTLILTGIGITVLGLIAWAIHQHVKNNPKTPKDDPFASSPGAAPSTSESTSSNPLGSKDRIIAFQKYAKSKGADLGTSGPNKDGVDGIWGSKTAAAWQRYGDWFLNTPSHLLK
jgi:hypothetical protein